LDSNQSKKYPSEGSERALFRFFRKNHSSVHKPLKKRLNRLKMKKLQIFRKNSLKYDFF